MYKTAFAPVRRALAPTKGPLTPAKRPSTPSKSCCTPSNRGCTPFSRGWTPLRRRTPRGRGPNMDTSVFLRSLCSGVRRLDAAFADAARRVSPKTRRAVEPACRSGAEPPHSRSIGVSCRNYASYAEGGKFCLDRAKSLFFRTLDRRREVPSAVYNNQLYDR